MGEAPHGATASSGIWPAGFSGVQITGSSGGVGGWVGGPGHVQPVGRPRGTWMHSAKRDVKDVGQQMGYRSLEWNWPKEAMDRSTWAGIVYGAKVY